MRYDQPSPALVWTINHLLGYKPVIEMFTLAGVQVYGQVQHTSLDQTVVTFATAQAGYASLR